MQRIHGFCHRQRHAIPLPVRNQIALRLTRSSDQTFKLARAKHPISALQNALTVMRKTRERLWAVLLGLQFKKQPFSVFPSDAAANKFRLDSLIQSTHPFRAIVLRFFIVHYITEENHCQQRYKNIVVQGREFARCY